MVNCSSVPTPAVDSGTESSMLPIDLPETPAQVEEVADLPFLELIGCMWWLAQMSRLDIFVALQRASKWVAKPSAKLWRWLVRILRYLAGTKHYGLVFTRDAKAPPLKAFVDASFADDPECKSTAGWVYFVHGAVVAYDSTTIKRLVTRSSYRHRKREYVGTQSLPRPHGCSDYATYSYLWRQHRFHLYAWYWRH